VSTAHVEALLTGLMSLACLAIFVISYRNHGPWRTAWKGPAACAFLLYVGLTVAELNGVTFIGPGGGNGSGISIP